MVTIVDFKERETSEGKRFFSLIVQGGVEMVMSQETGKYYLTARQASVTSTFNEQTCKELIGKQLPGKVAKIVSEPYEYTIKETGEVIKLHHSYAYTPDDAPVEEVVYEKEIAKGAFEF